MNKIEPRGLVVRVQTQEDALMIKDALSNHGACVESCCCGGWEVEFPFVRDSQRFMRDLELVEARSEMK